MWFGLKNWFTRNIASIAAQSSQSVELISTPRHSGAAFAADEIKQLLPTDIDYHIMDINTDSDIDTRVSHTHVSQR